MLANANQKSKIRRPNAAKEKVQSRKTPAMPLHVNAPKKKNSEIYAPSLFERRVMMLGMLARSLEMLENGKKIQV
jgi:hypothetical protein